MLEILIDEARILGAVGDRANGLYVAKDGFKGWESGSSGRRAATVRPVAHGEYDLPVFRGARVVKIDGYAVARSAFELGQLRDVVTGLGADGERVQVSVGQHDRVLNAEGRVLDASFVDSGWEDGPHGSFSVELVFADPRKYGEPHTFTGASVDVSHRGNFPASPMVEVVGPRTGPYTITGPGGRQVIVSQSLTAGQSHRIDFRSQRLYRDGVLQTGAVTKFDAWTVPARRQVDMSISAGSMTVVVPDTYI